MKVTAKNAGVSVIALALILALQGCASTWGHSSRNQQEFYRDSARCQAMARGGGSYQVADHSNPFIQGYNQGAAIRSAGQSRRIYDECMYGEGYYKTD